MAGGSLVVVSNSLPPPDPGSLVRQVVIPAHGTLSLSPFGLDIVLRDPGSLTVGATVPLVLTFRHAGRVTVYPAVAQPDTP